MEDQDSNQYHFHQITMEMLFFFTATIIKVSHILCELLTNSAFRVHQVVKKLSNIEYLK